jgi:hypothetical protein
MILLTEPVLATYDGNQQQFPDSYASPYNCFVCVVRDAVRARGGVTDCAFHLEAWFEEDKTFKDIGRSDLSTPIAPYFPSMLPVIRGLFPQ